MKLDKLIELYPWADHPIIKAYAERFSQKEWQTINDAGMQRLMQRFWPEFTYPQITDFFEVCVACDPSKWNSSFLNPEVALLENKLQMACLDPHAIDQMLRLRGSVYLEPEYRKEETELLIRKYVSKYQGRSTSAYEKDGVLSCALRAVAYAGAVDDLIWLLYLIAKDKPELTKIVVNTAEVTSGKTALHRAVEGVNRTGKTALHRVVESLTATDNRSCFDLLAKHPDIDFSVQDKDGKTPLDLWDFDRFPDATLLDKFNALQVVKEKSIVRPTSPLTANSVFVRPSVPDPADLAAQESFVVCNIL